ncbi:MAG: DsrE family protein [Aquificota bacterium]|nr:DsrE family protein [Aquificota bacterium]MDQ7082028.1 DsrE family protein [Aquificota bacterium]
MRRRDLLRVLPWLLLTPALGSEPEPPVRLLFPVTFRDRKRYRKVFLRIRGAINLWGAGAQILVVAYDEGIHFLDRFENGEFEERISNLMLYGVEFYACEVAMRIFEVPKEALFDGVKTVRSGFEFHVLKVREGYIPIYL